MKMQYNRSSKLSARERKIQLPETETETESTDIDIELELECAKDETQTHKTELNQKKRQLQSGPPKCEVARDPPKDMMPTDPAEVTGILPVSKSLKHESCISNILI